MKISLTGFEIAVVQQVLSVPGGSATIDDLRKIRGVVNTLKAVEKPDPERPASPGKDATDEQKKEYIAAMTAWAETVKALSEEAFEVELDKAGIDYAKKRLKVFAGFYSDEQSREKVLNLADKLGI